MIPDDFIQTLLGRVDIVEVIDRFVPLRKTGSNYVACCPFHREKTPSFTVSPTKQFYHCFGCGAHGTAIGFLMEHGGRPFVEAVEELARQVGMEVPRSEVARPGGEDRHGRLLAALAEAAAHYRHQLKASARAIDYLRARGLTGQVAARFGIGYAPAAWQSLADAVADYHDPVLEAAGLVVAGDGGKRYDRFRDRIMFPIHDARGQVVGFGGRVIDAGEPKYLNSPETAVFSKGRELYGLYLARQAIREADRVIVVEGYMDVVALAQNGVENVVATLGTATTPMHAAKLLRQAESVCFCFDGDEAGRRAAWRALENTLPALADGKDARFVFLPEGSDPDEYVRAHGREAFVERVERAMPLSQFLQDELVRRHPPTTAERKAALVADARPLLGALAAPAMQAILRRELARLAGLAPEEILPARSAHAEASPAARGTRAPAGSPSRSPAASGVARTLLKCVLGSPPLALRVDPSLEVGDTVEGRALAAVLAALADPEVARRASTAGVLQRLSESEHGALLWAMAARLDEERLDDSSLAAELDGTLALLRRRDEQARVTELVQRRSPSELTDEERLTLARYRRGPQERCRQPGERLGEPHAEGPAESSPPSPGATEDGV